MDFTEGSLFANLIVSAVGFFLLTYGRKTSDIRKVVLGLVMLVYPYFVSNAAVMIGIAVALVGGFWLFDTYV
jgi:predicted membrane protein